MHLHHSSHAHAHGCTDHTSCSHSHGHTHHAHHHEATGGCACGCHGHSTPLSERITLTLFGLSLVLLGLSFFVQPLSAYPWLLPLLAYLPVAFPIVRDAFHSVRNRDFFNEFTLMLVASMGAFALGEYTEAVAVLLFYTLGEYLQNRAARFARHDIRQLVQRTPRRATLCLADGTRQVVPSQSLQPGDLIEVKPGECVPVDGQLQPVSGSRGETLEQADFDTAALTGESMPRAIRVGETVEAGTLSLSQSVRLRVLRPESASAVQRMLHLIEDASQRKAPAERVIRRFAHRYTQIVFLLAVLLVLVAPLCSAQPVSVWLYRALVFLVVSCPCALVLSIPLAYFRGIGVASRSGILFRGGIFLDTLTRVKRVCFDKTGTLTTGEFEIKHLVACAPYTADQLCYYAASLEQGSNHPLARAIVREAKLPLSTHVEGVCEQAGKGVQGCVDGDQVVVGTEAFLQSLGLTLPVLSEAEAHADCSRVVCARGGQIVGYLYLTDELRPEAPQVVERLRAAGVDRLQILSGDRVAAVEALGKRLGIAAQGECTPELKSREVAASSATGTPVETCFLGDGFNDGPALASADVGVAWGTGGSDLAIETADVVLRRNSLLALTDAFSIARQVKRVVFQNIAFALGAKALVLLLASWGIAHLWMAILADTGVALLCVANIWRIRRGV